MTRQPRGHAGPSAPGVIPAPGRRTSAARRTSLSILMVSSEVAPFSKSGGLGDVAGALSAALGRQGHTVTLVTPRYRGITVSGHAVARLAIPLGSRVHEVELLEHHPDAGVRVLFVEHPLSFDRDGMYGVNGVDHADNAFRFALLSQAALQFAARHDRPTVVHAHEWQTGLVPLYLRQGGDAIAPLAGTPTVFTIHNLAFQGLFPPGTLPALNIGWDVFTTEGLEFWGHASWLKAGINFSDAITTVSPRYAQEILTPEFGFGFEGILAARQDRLVGILNGIDEEVWDPSDDPHLPATFTARNLAGKRVCKAALLDAFGLPSSEDRLDVPLIGMVTRLTDQKGMDLVAGMSEELVGLPAAFVVLGSGESRYEDMWSRLAARAPDRLGVRIGFDEGLAHLVEAGSDMFLMPSRFEPCGLNQMYSQRYGTVPIVRATGGLFDTVQDVDPASGRGTGFTFERYQPWALLDALQRALAAFRDRSRWTAIMRSGMRQKHSWDVSAREYVKVYRRVIRSRPRRRRAPAGRA